MMQIEMTLARRTDPETSHAAARRTKEFRARDISRIYNALRTHGPQTSHELAETTGLDVIACARRMKELCVKGLVRATAQTRESPSGRQATVWEAL